MDLADEIALAETVEITNRYEQALLAIIYHGEAGRLTVAGAVQIAKGALEISDRRPGEER